MKRKIHRYLYGGLISLIVLGELLGNNIPVRAQEVLPPGHAANAGGEGTVTCTVQNGSIFDPVFKPYMRFNCGSEAYGVAAGDFNHDGRTDVALSAFANVGGDTYQLLVLLQDGSRALAQPVVYAGGNGSVHLAVGDLNHDGWDDVVTAEMNPSYNTISVYLQQADGTLANRITYPTGSGPDAIAVGDVNADGYDDVLVSHAGSPTIGVFTQKVDGTLNVMVTYASIQAGDDDIAAGDVNGDGRTDVVKMNGQGDTTPHIMVYLQDVGGTLNPAVSYSIADCTQCLAKGLAVGDVTGDGRADVLLTYGLNSPTSRIAVFQQDANGALQGSASYPSYDMPDPIELADINSDSRSDVVVLHSGWTHAGVYLQQDGGAVGPELLYQTPNKPNYNSQDLDVADVNGDGLSDLLIADGQGLAVLYHRLPVPAALTPAAKTSDRTPTFTWSRISGATQYRFQVMKGSTLVYTQGMDASLCGANTCSDTPAAALSDGAYTWRAALMLNGIWSDYGTARPFSVDAVPNLVAPSGVLYDPTPAYKWQKVLRATQYRYQLMKGTAPVYTKQAGAAACGSLACLSTPAYMLTDGSYKWRAQALVDGSWQPYSAYMTFSVKTVPAPLAPSGTILDSTPTYKWTKIAGATQYRYQLMQDTNLVYTKTADAASCGTLTCASTPTNVLSYNLSYKWRVQAMVAGVWRPFSAYKLFTPDNKPRAGFWKSFEGFDRFYVTPDQKYVDDFTIIVSVVGCNGPYQITHSAPVTINNNKFLFSSSGFYSSGTFSTTTRMSGTDGLDNYYIPGCGEVNGGPWAYSTTWQNDSQPLVATLVPGSSIDIVELIQRRLDGLRATRIEGALR